MKEHILTGQKVRLLPFDPKTDAKKFLNWRQNSEYLRLMGGSPARLVSIGQLEKWLEMDELSDEYVGFQIQSLDDQRMIGETGLEGFKSGFVNAFVGISIGDPEDWGKGFGTDAMQVIMRYGFEILNLHRITLTVFEYNPRAIRSYEKVGFKHEGAHRQWLNRDGRRWDMLRMGILKEEWQAIYLQPK